MIDPQIPIRLVAEVDELRAENAKLRERGEVDKALIEHWKSEAFRISAAYDMAEMTIEKQSEKINKLREQRDRLVEAFKTFINWYDERSGDNECRPLENARAILAEIEGEGNAELTCGQQPAKEE